MQRRTLFKLGIASAAVLLIAGGAAAELSRWPELLQA